MNVLTDRLPTTIEVDGKTYEINSNFRTGIKFEIMIDEKKSGSDIVKEALKLFYPVIPQNIEEAVQKIVWFYCCGQTSKSIGTSGISQRAYSFKHDAGYIYSAFLQQYGIDLQMAELHWWQFRYLFRSLSEDCLITKIMQYRTAEITSGMSKSEKDRIRKLKRIYALPLSDEEKKRQEDIEKILMGSGDLSKLGGG